MVRLPGVTDVLVNGPDHVYVDRGAGLERTEVRFADDEAVRRLAQRLAAAGGRRLDDATPYVDVRLPDGTRLHAVLAPDRATRHVRCRCGCRPGRRSPSTTWWPRGRSTAAGARLLATWSRRGWPSWSAAAPGSGKTTLLSTLLGLVEPAERLVAGRGLRRAGPDHPHVVTLEARPPNVETAGEVTVRDLVRQALRMRPDRLVVGEVRGAEVTELLAALNTGHEGGCGTIHANSAADVPARVEALALAAGLPRAAAHSQFAAAARRGRAPRSEPGRGDGCSARWPCPCGTRRPRVDGRPPSPSTSGPAPGRARAPTRSAARLDR